MINIIGGTKKRTNIQVTTNLVRPTSSHKRESIFSIIKSYESKINKNIYQDKYILDLFSGTGALGLEAISRGSLFAYFYENNIEVLDNLKKNCLQVCETKNFKIINEDILKSDFSNIENKISLVFIDPPYNINPFEKVLININKSKKLFKNALIVIECEKKIRINIPSSFFCINERTYGKTKIYFLINKAK